MISVKLLMHRLALVMAALLITVAAVPAIALAQSAPAAAAMDPTTDYILGSGDKVRVIVYGEDSLSGEFYVSGSGIVALPLIGEVKAAGLTLRAFQDLVQKTLSDGYLREPRVSAEVLNFRPFYILGEVTKPGTYPYTSNLTVLNAVATAGGFTYRADKNKVYIKRNGDTEEKKYELNPSSTVAPGDSIRIGERFF